MVVIVTVLFRSELIELANDLTDEFALFADDEMDDIALLARLPAFVIAFPTVVPALWNAVPMLLHLMFG